MSQSADFLIHKLTAEQRTELQDNVAVEEPLEIWLKMVQSAESTQTKRLVTTMRTPGDDISLVKGWLNATGLLQSDQIHSIEHTGTQLLKGYQSNQVLVTLMPGQSIDSEKVQHIEYVSSSCGVCGQQSIEHLLDSLPPAHSEYRLSLPVSQLYTLVGQLREQQGLFSKTGGNHAVGLFDETALVLDVCEDVGRHNAMDKLIGANLKRLPGKFGVVLSGRVSFEMVHKAAMAGISMIVAVGAPTSLAIELCKECDICLIGFVKKDSLNIYHDNRQLAQY